MGKRSGCIWSCLFYIEKDKEIFAKGPVGKFFSKDALKEINEKTGAEIGDSIFLACNKKHDIEKISSLARDKIAEI